MTMNNHLSKNEFTIYSIIKEIDFPTIITNKEIQDIFPDIPSKNINHILKKLYQKKYLLKIERAKYILNKSYTINELYILSINIYFGYISYLSALKYYKLIDYNPQTIFVSTKNKSKEINIDNYKIKYISVNNFEYYKKDNFYISTLEKTIFDCINKVEFSGGYSTITKAIYDAYKKIDWNILEKIYKKYASKRQKQITGYLLDLISKKTNLKINNNFYKYLIKQEKSKTYLLNIKNKRSKYNSKWKIKDNFGEENIISWCY